MLPDVRCYLHGGPLRVGDLDAARDVADELRHERPIDGDVYLLIGESYESMGDSHGAPLAPPWACRRGERRRGRRPRGRGGRRRADGGAAASPPR